MKIGDSASLCYRLKTSGRMSRWTDECKHWFICEKQRFVSCQWSRLSRVALHCPSTSRLNTLPSDQWIAEEKWFVINVSGISIFYIITPSTEALVLFSLHFMSPKCPIRFNVSLLKWINLAKLPGWCEYLCALCLSDGARLPFFFPSSMEMCWYFQLRG